jgi:hypothetical protein
MGSMRPKLTHLPIGQISRNPAIRKVKAVIRLAAELVVLRLPERANNWPKTASRATKLITLMIAPPPTDRKPNLIRTRVANHTDPKIEILAHCAAVNPVAKIPTILGTIRETTDAETIAMMGETIAMMGETIAMMGETIAMMGEGDLAAAVEAEAVVQTLKAGATVAEDKETDHNKTANAVIIPAGPGAGGTKVQARIVADSDRIAVIRVKIANKTLVVNKADIRSQLNWMMPNCLKVLVCWKSTPMGMDSCALPKTTILARNRTHSFQAR